MVQKHDATRLHYDFRLETKDGVLSSWAVPKGISIDPKVKRLAIKTEDHPVDYLHFEGVIPSGNYGAGTVIVWDTGSYVSDLDISNQIQDGRISITLMGQKLKGKFILVRRKAQLEENHWLLIKGTDQFASDEDLTVTSPYSVLSHTSNEDLARKVAETGSMPSNLKKRKTENQLESDAATGSEKLMESATSSPSDNEFPTECNPMLGILVDRPFDSSDWIFEVKWDGVRAFVFLDRPRKILELKSRNDKPLTHRYPDLLSPLTSAISCDVSTVLDGEIVVLDKEGFPDFQNHQRRMNVDYSRDIERLVKEIPATYYAFDILYLDGRNVQSMSFMERRSLLLSIVEPSNVIRISDYIDEKGIEVFERIKNMNLEGVMAKKKSSKYSQGIRSSEWLKIKNIKTQDCIVIGYTRGEGNRQGYFGSLLLAMYDDESRDSQLRFVGHVGSGFDFNMLHNTFGKLDRITTNTCPIDYVPYTNRDPVWLRPELVVEVKFHGWTKDKIMRAPIFLRFREEKSPNECKIESEKKLADLNANAVMNLRTNDNSQSIWAKQQGIIPTTPRMSNRSAYNESFSNLDKTFWKKVDDRREITKLDLIEYYDRVSDYLLPYLRNRPVSLNRFPDGADGEHFFHKNWKQNKPDYVMTARIFSDSYRKLTNYIICNNRETLLWLANLGCIEMHPWFSRVDEWNGSEQEEKTSSLDYPDFIIFDLDPYIYSGTEAKGQEPEYNVKGFRATVQVGFHLKGILDRLGIKSYVKTSGKTGLHIFVPTISSYMYEQTRTFAQIIGKMLVRKYPEKVTMEWDTIKREGKVFFDYNQNSKGKTIASVFSVRPTLSASVSMPLRWEELSSIVPTDYTLLNVPEILEKTGDPWKNLLHDKQDINSLLQKL